MIVKQTYMIVALGKSSEAIKKNLRVPDFGGWYLDMAPNFSQYWQFNSTIINVRTDGNPNKMGITHHIRQRLCAQVIL